MKMTLNRALAVALAALLGAAAGPAAADFGGMEMPRFSFPAPPTLVPTKGCAAPADQSETSCEVKSG